jgi:hypothetical protein
MWGRSFLHDERSSAGRSAGLAVLKFSQSTIIGVVYSPLVQRRKDGQFSRRRSQVGRKPRQCVMRRKYEVSRRVKLYKALRGIYVSCCASSEEIHVFVVRLSV